MNSTVPRKNSTPPISRIRRKRGQRLPVGSEKTNGVTSSGGNSGMRCLLSSDRKNKKIRFCPRDFSVAYVGWDAPGTNGSPRPVKEEGESEGNPGEADVCTRTPHLCPLPLPQGERRKKRR